MGAGTSWEFIWEGFEYGYVIYDVNFQYSHMESSENDEHIPINLWCFSWRNYWDDDGIFAGIRKFFACSQVFKFVVEWINSWNQK